MRITKRLATGTAATVLAMSGVVVAAPSAAAASGHVEEGPVITGGCLPEPAPVFCGGIGNESSHTARYTADLRAKDDNCTVWNWDGGSAKNEQDATCGDPTELSTGEEAGGNFSGVDVDALTFGTRYWVNFDGGNLYFPVEAGTWTKIQTDQWAACEDDSALNVVCHID